MKAQTSSENDFQGGVGQNAPPPQKGLKKTLICLIYLAIEENALIIIIYYQGEEEGAYGIDWEGPTAIQESENVEVPKTSIPTGFSLEELERNVDPLADSDEYGIDLYIKLLQYIGSH